MNFTDDALQILAQQLGEERASSREELEAKVTPLLCLILRTGMGRPSLVQWVQRNLRVAAPAARFGDKIDPKWAAPRLARLLCSRMLQQIRSRHATAVSRDSVVA